MKKLLTILLVVFGFVCISQEEKINANGTKTTIGGHIITDSISYRIKPAALSAFIRTGSNTTTTEASKWYYLKGTFVNEDSHSFGFTGDTVQYQNGDYGHLIGSCDFTATSDVNGTTLYIGIFFNNSLDSTSFKSHYFKTSGEPYPVTCNISHVCMHDDKIKIMIMTDKPGANIMFTSGSTFLHQIP